MSESRTATEIARQHELQVEARMGQAKLALEEEINHCTASVTDKAYLRQKVAHLWQLVKQRIGGT